MIATSEQIRVSLRVLHLEDNPVDAALIQTELRERNIPCSVTRICTQENFEAELQKGGVDLILSDSQLPGFDTLSALTRAREICPTVPFIFVSGTASPKVKADAFVRGASDFISKEDLPKLARVLEWLFFLNKLEHAISPLPEVGMPVIVQCKEFRCLGYFDRQGTWRDFEKSSELSEVVAWFNL